METVNLITALLIVVIVIVIVIVVVSASDGSNKVKYIVLNKVSVNEASAADAGANVIQIAELQAYEGDKLLTASDYELVEYKNSPKKEADTQGNYLAVDAVDGDINTYASTSGVGILHTMIFTLKNPMKITKINVIGRKDCCRQRLPGIVMSLLNDKNVELYTTRFNEAFQQKTFDITYPVK